MKNNKDGFMLLEILVAITISAIIMGSLTGFLPNMMMKNNIISKKNIETKRGMVDYMIVMKDLRGSEMASIISKEEMILYKKGNIVKYKIMNNTLTRIVGEGHYPTVYEELKVYACNVDGTCDRWSETSTPLKVDEMSWWKISMRLGNTWHEGVVKGL